MLATLQGQLALGLALDALQSQNNLLGSLSLLVEDRLGLTTITGLLAVITTLSLSEQRGLASLVLGDLVLGVLAALLALAVGVAGLGNVDLVIPIRVSFTVFRQFACFVSEVTGGAVCKNFSSSFRGRGFWFAAASRVDGRDSKSWHNFSSNLSKSRRTSGYSRQAQIVVTSASRLDRSDGGAARIQGRRKCVVNAAKGCRRNKKSCPSCGRKPSKTK